MKKLYSILFFISISLISCLYDNNSKSRNVDPNTFYLEYRISGSEDEDNVIIYAQVQHSKNGNPIPLNNVAKILLDGEELNSDSARLGGTFYELQKPLNAFEGKHEIVFVSPNNKEYKNEFDFKSFQLKTKIPEELTRSDLKFDFTGLEKLDVLRIVATDTSFTSTDINEFDTVRNGRLIIPEWRLNNVKNGHINILFSKEQELPVRIGGKMGGRIAISYELRREFVLKD